jgi:DNA-binding NtrC family response regulator
MFLDPDVGVAAAGATTPANSNDCRRLLVVDGDSGFVTLARAAGKRLGFMVEATSQARELARIYDSFMPSVIIFDFFTVGMDGIELMNWLHDRNSDAHVILTSRKESFFLGVARELAVAKGYLNVETLVEPQGSAAVSDLLIQRLSNVEGRKAEPGKYPLEKS